MDSVSFITKTFDWQGVLDIEPRRKLQRTLPFFLYRKKKKEWWPDIMKWLVLPILLTPRTICTNLTYFYLPFSSVGLFWNDHIINASACTAYHLLGTSNFSYQSKDHPAVNRAFDNRKWGGSWEKPVCLACFSWAASCTDDVIVIVKCCLLTQTLRLLKLLKN